MSTQPLSDHMPYVIAVRDALKAVGLKTEGVGGLAHWAEPGPGEGRNASIHLSGLMYWSREEYDNTIELTVEWHETRGWYIHDTHELGAVRGDGHRYMGLGLGIVPTPAEVAARVAEGFADGAEHFDRGHTERKTGPYDAELEELLAGYGGG